MRYIDTTAAWDLEECSPQYHDYVMRRHPWPHPNGPDAWYSAARETIREAREKAVRQQVGMLAKEAKRIISSLLAVEVDAERSGDVRRIHRAARLEIMGAQDGGNPWAIRQAMREGEEHLAAWA